jgi:hypothetical protein
MMLSGTSWFLVMKYLYDYQYCFSLPYEQMKENHRLVIVSLFPVDNKRLKVLIGKVI